MICPGNNQTIQCSTLPTDSASFLSEGSRDVQVKLVVFPPHEILDLSTLLLSAEITLETESEELWEKVESIELSIMALLSHTGMKIIARAETDEAGMIVLLGGEAESD